jgi:hypothetical protein
MFWRPWLHHFYVQSPQNFLVEDYKIFYTIYKWIVSSIQCKMGLRRSTTARVDSRSLIQIYFNILRFMPGLHWAETALEFSDNKILAFCSIQWQSLASFIYRVIHKSLRNFRTTTKGAIAERSTSVGRESLQVWVIGAMAYLQGSPLGGSVTKHRERWGRQGIRKRSVSWNLPKLSQLWQCKGGFGPSTTQNHPRTKQFVSGTINSSIVGACALRNEQAVGSSAETVERTRNFC